MKPEKLAYKLLFATTLDEAITETNETFRYPQKVIQFLPPNSSRARWAVIYVSVK